MSGLDITGLSSVFDFGSKLLGKIFPDPEEKAKAQAILKQLDQNGELAESNASMNVVVAEAKSESWLTANWRPLTMLTFVIIIANNYIVYPWRLHRLQGRREGYTSMETATMKDYLLSGLILAILFSLSSLALADDPHIGTVSPSNATSVNKHVTINNQIIGTAMALAAAQHHFDMRTHNVQTSIGMGYFQNHIAWSAGAGLRLGQGKLMINGSVGIEQGKTGFGAGLNMQW